MLGGPRLDRIDLKILTQLQQSGRITNVELSRRAGISPPPCLRRVRALEDAGYILGYHADLEPKALGFHVTVFAQVGLSSQAENREGKPRSSYELEARTMTPQDVRRYVHGEYGYVIDGEPIYPQFSLELHRSDAWLKPIPGIPLLLGFDLGGSPACVIAQATPEGQLRILREICCTPGSGPVTIARLTRECLLQEFAGFAIGGAWIDPSGFYGADKQSGQLAAAEIVSQMLNINIQPGPSQEPGFRTDSVRWYLTGLIDGHLPRMVVDPRCKYLIGGFVAHYKLTKQASTGATNLMVPVKNEYSHVHDALQYLVTGYRGRAGVIRDVAQDGLPGNVTPLRSTRAKADFNVFDI